MRRRLLNPTGALFSILLLLLFQMSTAALAANLPNFTKLVKEAEPAVVNISTTEKVTQQQFRIPNLPNLPENSPFNEFFKRFFEQNPNMPRNRYALGSGFIISADGYILTNAHVVKGADKIVVRLNNGQEKPGKLVGLDERTDVALVKIDGKDLPTAKIGDSDTLEVGQWVLAIGSPFGLEHTATQGIISALGRNLPNESYVPFIQTDAAVNPGNSGGPLFNLDGEVIGINSQIYSNTGGYMGLSFAIPISVAMNVAKQLETHGVVTRGWLGVMIQGINQELAQSFGLDRPRGALVSQVMPDSPAAKAGLEPGDIILEYNGKPIEQWSQLPTMVGGTPVGDTVALTVLRHGKSETIKVTIAKLTQQAEQQAQPTPGGGQENSVLKLTVSNLSDEQRQELGVGDRGVLVEDVGAGPAADADIQPDDVILAINHHNVTSVAELANLAKDLPKGKAVPVLVQRDGSSIFLALRIPANG